MAKIRLTGATFTAASKTVLHTSFSDVGLPGIQLITNVTDGIVIYQFNDPAKGGTLSTDTLTLDYDTTSMSDTDELMILVEDGVASTAINDGGNTITVDGTVAVTNAGLTELAGAINGSAQMDVNIAANGIGLATSAKQDTGNTSLATLAGAVAGTEVQVDVLTMPTVTVNAHAVTNAGTFPVQVDGSALTALQLIDDPIATLGTTTYTEASTKGNIVGAVRRDADTTLVDTTNEVAPLQVDARGALKVEVFSGETLPVSFTGSTDVATQTTLASALTSLQLIDNAVSGSGFNITKVNGEAIDVGAGTEAAAIRVTLPTDGTGVLTVKQSTAGNLNMTEASASAIKTAVELIDDTVKVLGTDTYTEATSKGVVMGAVRRDADTTLANTTNEFTPLQVDANGYLKVEVFSGATLPVSVASGGIASGGIASGAVASGAVASGAFASGSIASGAIAAGAIAAGNTSIATTEDTATAAGEHLLKNGIVRYDTPVSGANVSGTADWMPPIADSFGKAWVTGTVPEDTAHIDTEAIVTSGERRIDTAATSAGSSGDWATKNQSAEGASWATLTPTTTSGCSVFMASGSDGSSILVATAQVIKASAGNLYGYYAYNPEAAVTFVHFYNTAAASVTVGTTSPLFTIAIPAGAAANLALPFPITFSNAGWSCAATTTAGGNTAPATGISLVAWYK